MNNRNDSLYERIGGKEGVIRLVDSFYMKVMLDRRLDDFFAKTAVPHLKNMQQEFFTLALGGPSKYSDMDLARAHQGRSIKAQHFKAFVDILFETLSEFDLTEDERYQIVSSLNTYVDDIVEDGQAGVI